jgi:hypothetical protein
MSGYLNPDSGGEEMMLMNYSTGALQDMGYNIADADIETYDISDIGDYIGV